MEITLATLKTFGLILSGAFGLIGTFSDLKNKNTGKLTFWGKTSLIGISLSIITATSAQILEAKLNMVDSKNAAIAALRATEKLDAVVSNLSRTLQSFRHVSFYIGEVSVPMDAQFIQSYKEKFDERLAEFFALKSNDVHGNNDFDIRSIEYDENMSLAPTRVTLNENSDLVPRRSSSELIRNSLASPTVNLTFYKTPIDPRIFYPLHHGKGDLQISFYGNDEIDVGKKLDSDIFYFNGHFKTVEANGGLRWSDHTGKILSLPDLLGAQMFIVLGGIYARDLEDTNTNKLINAFREKYELNVASISFGERSLWLTKDNLVKHVGANNVSFWEHNFSSNEDEYLQSPNLQ